MFYEYRCPECGKYDVVNRKIEERETAPCTAENCSGTMVKIISAPPEISAHSLPTRRRYGYMKPSKVRVHDSKS